MNICFKIIKFFITLYVVLHVSDTTVSIIRSLPPLHMQPLVIVWCCVGCVLQPCSVVTACGKYELCTRLSLLQTKGETCAKFG
jgi:hypothetical protein